MKRERGRGITVARTGLIEFLGDNVSGGFFSARRCLSGREEDLTGKLLRTPSGRNGFFFLLAHHPHPCAQACPPDPYPLSPPPPPWLTVSAVLM